MLEDDEWKGFEWQTLDGRVPPDSPPCGFFNELCPEVIKGNLKCLDYREYGPRCEKTCLRGLQHNETQTSLISYRD